MAMLKKISEEYNYHTLDGITIVIHWDVRQSEGNRWSVVVHGSELIHPTLSVVVGGREGHFTDKAGAKKHAFAIIRNHIKKIGEQNETK